MNNPKVSVIVPVFNMEKYLHKCVDSILAQTFEDFELLLIDDGSKDASGAICDEYAIKDTRVRVFHKPNGGVSSARNMGLDNAKGQYITFADSDDWMEENWLNDMIKNICGTDLVIQGFYMHQGDSVKQKTLVTGQHLRGEYDSICNELLINYQLGYLWSMLFKKELIYGNEILFDEKIGYQEDLDFILRYLLNTVSFKTLSVYNYHYYFAPQKSYPKSLYEIDKIMSLLCMLLSGDNLIFHKKRYGCSAARLLIKDNNPNMIKSVRQYYVKYGQYFCGKSATIIVPIISLFPAGVAKKIIDGYNSLLKVTKHI